MRMTADAINRNRARIKWVVRGVAAVLLTFGAYLVLKRVGYLAGSGDFGSVFRYHSGDMGETNSMYRGLALLLVGGGLALLSDRVSRWIVTLPVTSCPRCGHHRGPGATSCPECGLELGASD
jgi:hypothetical protein